MAIGAKLSETVVTETPVVAKEIKHVIRTIAAEKVHEGVEFPWETEKHLGELFAAGWMLLSVHPLGRSPDGYEILWVLVK